MLKEILTARTRPSDKALYNIWARKISGGWTETTITGTLPLAFQAKGGDLTDYTVHGTAEGAGAQTANLFNKDAKDTAKGYVYHGMLESDGSISSDSSTNISEYIPIEAGKNYVFRYGGTYQNYWACIYDAEKNFVRSIKYSNSTTKSFTAAATELFLRITYKIQYVSRAAVYEGNDFITPIPPYGYEIPLTLTDGTNSTDYNLYIGETKLGADEYLDYAEQKIYKDVSGTLTPTDPPLPFPAIAAYQGANTMSSTETVGSVSLTGKIKEAT